MKIFIIAVYYRIGFSVETIEAETFNGACNDLIVTLPWKNAEKIIGFKNCQTGEHSAKYPDIFDSYIAAGIIPKQRLIA